MILRSLVFKSDGVGHLRLDVPLASPPTAKEKEKVPSDEDKCTTVKLFLKHHNRSRQGEVNPYIHNSCLISEVSQVMIQQTLCPEIRLASN